MKRARILLGLILGVAIAATANPTYGQLFGKKAPTTPPVPPQQRVPELLKLLKEDGDENKRLDAIEELRGIDVTKHPEMIPVLIETLLNDKKPSVRTEAAFTLGKIRPVQQGIGVALEFTRDNDSSMRVRLQARSTLMGYYLAGYRTVKPEEVKGTPPATNPSAPSGKEPPLAPAGNLPPVPMSGTGPRLTPVPTGSTPLVPVPMTTTNPPPVTSLPPVTSAPPVAPMPPNFQALPKGPTPSGPELGPPPR